MIGILAARIRERFHRPVIAFAPGPSGELRGSGRSIPSLHLRDALDLVEKREPGLLLRFGGHASAAGLSIRQPDFARFRTVFDNTLRELLTPADLHLRIETDGSLLPSEMSLAVAERLTEPVWGQGFPPPRFHGDFRVDSQRVMGGNHLRLELTSIQPGARAASAVLFGSSEPLPDAIHAVFRLDINEYNAMRSLQLVLEHWEPAHVAVSR